MGKKVDFENKAVNVPSWSLPISMINNLEVLATNKRMSKSQLLQIIIAEYFNTQAEELFIYPEDATPIRVVPREGRYIMPLF